MNFKLEFYPCSKLYLYHHSIETVETELILIYFRRYFRNEYLFAAVATVP